MRKEKILSINDIDKEPELVWDTGITEEKIAAVRKRPKYSKEYRPQGLTLTHVYKEPVLTWKDSDATCILKFPSSIICSPPL